MGSLGIIMIITGVMGNYGMWGVISSIVSALLGGSVMYMLTLKSLRRKAAAEARQLELKADETEINNIEKAITIWKKMAEDLAKELEDTRKRSEELKLQIENLGKQVAKLTNINSKILHLLDKITPDNLEQTVGEMKKLIEKP